MRRKFAQFLPMVAIAASILTAITVACAQDASISAQTVYIVDYQTGGVMLDKNSMARSEPASLTKMMTAYLAFEALKEGKIKLTDTLPASQGASRMRGSRMFIERGSNIKFEDLLRGIIVQSGNDACVVVAEGLAGSEEAFVQRMNAKAKEFGMMGTHFANSSGWPDPDHYTTARDLAILAHHVIADFPEYYHYFSEIDFTYHGIKQGNRNPLLYKNVGVDGIKTGYADGPGYSLVSSGVQNGRRIIMVILGLDSKQSRSDEAIALWRWAFLDFDNYRIAKGGTPLVNAPVWLGQEDTVPVGPKDDVVLTLPRNTRNLVKATAVFDGPLAAPIAPGQVVGKLRLESPGLRPTEVPLIATSGVKHLGTFGSMIVAAKYLIWG
jgi:serine-type D-Ala-D-Ala carboxypeptidase (penicillin-binding protein 5/6)